MISLLLPPTVSIAILPGFLKREGPRGSVVKKTGDFHFHLVETPEGKRLFLDLPSQTGSPSSLSSTSQSNQTRISARLSLLASLAEGLSRGYRRRLRLVGVGFRALLAPSTSSKTLSLKLGYSHEVQIPLEPITSQGRERTPSRLEGRSKGTLLRLQGTNRATLHHLAATVRDFRRPDIYKGKGIHYDREVLRLKKGKREG